MMFRTLLFIPGNNKRFLEKSKFLYPDILCFDLEDSVPTSEKTIARDMIIESFSSDEGSNQNHLKFLLELIHLNLEFTNKI
jgi:citrate lyase subunit beta / citryl-CoA lyase